MSDQEGAPGIEFTENAPLAPMTTLDLGGRAKYLCVAVTVDEVVEALRWADERQAPATILGGGSNLVVSDSGLNGLIVRMGMRGIDLAREADHVSVTVAAGESWDEVVAMTVSENLAGLECLSGIPGTVGATPIQNVGAYGQQVADTIATVQVVDRRSLTSRALTPEDCGFGYRTSRFRRHPDQFVVTSVTFNLSPGGQPTLRYPQLTAALEPCEKTPSLHQVRQTVLDLRRSKSMVLEESDPNRRSVGSFFLNPEVTASEAQLVQQRAGAEEMPCYPVADEVVKIPAAWLIERCGFAKGHRAGRVGISSRHSLALVHHGEGTAAELVDLAREIRSAVRERFGIDLRPEPTFVGFADSDPTA